jgi:tetratricopeptide (TPR) repeat protein
MPNQAPARPRRWQATLIIALVFLAAVAAASAGWWYARESPPHQGPIVLISADGLSNTSLPAYGAAPGHTPGIDALAQDGVVFERAYTHSPELLPANASLLTGELPPVHGVRDDAGFTLADDLRTMPELLRNRGFATGAAVSSYLLRRESGAAQGFSFFDAELPPVEGQATPVARDGNLTLDAAMRWLRTQDGRRFFLFLQVPGTDADAVVGELAGLLHERGLYDTATIVLVGGRGSLVNGALDEATLRVPLIVKQPDSEGAGRRVQPAVQHIDLLPTLLDLVRAPVPGSLRGRSLRSVLDDDGEIADGPIYAESLSAFFRFGGHPVYALLSNGVRYTREAAESLTSITGPNPNTTPPDMMSLRATVDRLLGAAPLPAPARPADGDADRLALAGILLGPTPPAGPPATPVVLDAGAQAVVLSAHQRAARLAGGRDLAGAIQGLQQIARTHPPLAAIQFQLGELFTRAGRFDDALAAFQAVNTAWPDHAGAALGMATALRRAGRLDDAAMQAGRAITFTAQAPAGDRAAAQLVATLVALDRKDPDAAAEHARLGEDAAPGLPLTAFVRGRTQFDMGEADEALVSLTEAEKTATTAGTAIPGLHLALGECLAHLERYDEAEAQFKEELRAFPHATEPYVSLAMTYRAANRHADAERVLGELTQATPTPEAYAVAARVWTVLGDRERAERLRRDARARFAGDPSLALLGRGARR